MERKEKQLKISQKVERLEAYCRNNFYIWRNRSKSEIIFSKIEDKQERKKAQKELNEAISYYDYIRRRKSEGHLSQEYIIRLRNAGVGGVFRSSEYIQELSERYEIDRNLLNEIEKNFGSLENFRKIYIQALIDRNINEVIPEELFEKLKNSVITCFDISSPDFTSKENRFVPYLETIIGNQACWGLILDGNKLEYNINEALSTLALGKAKVERLLFGLNGGKKYTHTEAAQSCGVSVTTIGNRHKVAINKIRQRFHLFEESTEGIEESKREEFIRKYFEKYDIFYTRTPFEIDEQIRSELLKIYDIGFQQKEERKEQEKQRKTEIEMQKQYLQRCSLEVLEKLLQVDEIKTFLEQNEEISVDDLKIDSEIKIRLNNAGIRTLDMLFSNFEDAENIQEILSDKTEYKNVIFAMIEQALPSKYISKAIQYRRKQFMTIEELDLSVRTFNCLKRAEIKTVHQLTMLSDEELMNIRNLGRGSYNELMEKLKLLGLDMPKEITKLPEEQSEEQSEETLIDELDLSIKTYNAVARLGIKSVQDLLQISIKNLRSLEKKSYDEIFEKIHAKGLVLSCETTIGKGTPIQELGLSPRALKSLNRAGIETVEELLLKSDEELYKLRNLGKKTYNEIQEKLKANGFSNHNETTTNDEIHRTSDTVDNTQEEENTQEETDLEAVLKSKIEELKAAYKELEQKSKKLEDLKANYIIELENLTSNKSELSEIVATLNNLLQNNYEAFKLTGMLETFEERLKQEREKLVEEERKAKLLQTQISDIEKQALEVESEKRKIEELIDRG